MNFVINTSQDKQNLFNYLKELETDYIVKVKKQRNEVHATILEHARPGKIGLGKS